MASILCSMSARNRRSLLCVDASIDIRSSFQAFVGMSLKLMASGSKTIHLRRNEMVCPRVKRGMSSSGKCKAKAASFSCSTWTLYPDASMHCFHELFTDVESQATPSRRPSKVTLEAHKFAKEQGKFSRGNTGTRMFHTDTQLRGRVSSLCNPLTQCRADDHCCLPGAILEGVRKQMAQDLAQVLWISPDGQVLRDIQVELIVLCVPWIKVFNYFTHHLDDRIGFELRRVHLTARLCGSEHLVDQKQEFLTPISGMLEECRLYSGIQVLLMIAEQFDVYRHFG